MADDINPYQHTFLTTNSDTSWLNSLYTTSGVDYDKLLTFLSGLLPPQDELLAASDYLEEGGFIDVAKTLRALAKVQQ